MLRLVLARSNPCAASFASALRGSCIETWNVAVDCDDLASSSPAAAPYLVDLRRLSWLTLSRFHELWLSLELYLLMGGSFTLSSSILSLLNSWAALTDLFYDMGSSR